MKKETRQIFSAIALIIILLVIFSSVVMVIYNGVSNQRKFCQSQKELLANDNHCHLYDQKYYNECWSEKLGFWDYVFMVGVAIVLAMIALWVVSNFCFVDSV